MDGYVTIKEIAEEFGIDKSNARKYILDNGFVFEKTRTAETQNQLTLVLPTDQAGQVKQLRLSQGFSVDGQNGIVDVDKVGTFYIIQLVPELDDRRVKFGYTGNLSGRLRAHQTTCPNAKVFCQYSCRDAWEITAIASIAREGCQFISNEVYQVDNLDKLMQRAEDFFSLMPNLEGK